MNERIDDNIINQTPVENAETSCQRLTDDGFPHRGDAFETQYASFSAAIDQLRAAAIALDAFDLQVKLKWKKDPSKSTPTPDEIKFPEPPRYVTDDVATMVAREERKQRLKAKENGPAQEIDLQMLIRGIADGTINKSDERAVALRDLIESAKHHDIPDFHTYIEAMAEEQQLLVKKPDEPDRTT